MNMMDCWKKGLTCVVTGVPPSTTSDWLAQSQIQQVHWELDQTERSIILWTEESRSRVWLNIRCSVSISGFLSPGLWSFPVFSFWCLALQTHEWPHEGRFSKSWRQKLLHSWCSNSLNLSKTLPHRSNLPWSTGTHLSCLRAYSSILIRLTKSCFMFSWPFLSPCRNATWAWEICTQRGKLEKNKNKKKQNTYNFAASLQVSASSCDLVSKRTWFQNTTTAAAEKPE